MTDQRNYFDRFDIDPNADLTKPQGGMERPRTRAELERAVPQPAANYFDQYDGAVPKKQEQQEKPSEVGWGQWFDQQKVGWGLMSPADYDQKYPLTEAQKNAPTTISAAPPRSLGERFMDSAEAGLKHYSPAAIASRAIAGTIPSADTWSGTPGADNSQAAQSARARDNMAAKERDWREAEAIRDAADPIIREGDSWYSPGSLARGAAMLGGGMVGGAAGDPTSFIAPGKSILTKMAGQAAVGGGVDALSQGAEMAEGVRDEYSPLQTAISAGAGATLVGGIEGIGRIRKWWSDRGVNVDSVPDDQLVAGSLDGTIGGPDAAAELKAFLGYADQARGQNPLIDEALNRRGAELNEAALAQQAAERPAAPNFAEGMAAVPKKKAGTALDELLQAREAGALPDRTIPDDVPIIAAPEGNIRADDAGGMAGLDRKRNADSTVLSEAQRRVADDPLVASILDSNLSPQAKVATIWQRLGQEDPGPMPDLPEVPQASPWTAPTPGAAAGIASRAANPGRSRIHDITMSTESNGRRYGADGKLLRSPKGAQGEMQVMPGTSRDPGYGVRPAQNDSPDELARVGRDYIDALRDHYGGDMRKAWAAYNGGPGAVDGAIRKHGANWLDHMPAETRAYVNKNMTKLGGAEPQAPYRAGDYSGTGADYSFDAFDAGTPLRRNTTANMGEAEVPESAAARAYRESQSGEMATGNSTRPFRADPESADFEARANATADEQYAAAMERLQREWEAREQVRREREANRGADQRFEQERVRTAEEARGDPSGLYRGKYAQKPHLDGEVWRTTPEGFVAGSDGKPVAFRNARDAVKWAAKNKMGGDFELAAWATNSNRVVLKRRENSTYGQQPPRPTGPQEPAAGRSADTSQRMLESPVVERDAASAGPQPARTPDMAAPVERAPIPPESRPALTGGAEQVVTPRGRAIDTEFEVREARDLIDSAHPAFDQRFQPRERGERAASDAQIADMAARLDPEQLHSSRLASHGAPIVGPDRLVESGNGRTAAIRRAYQSHPEKAGAYRAMIERRGFDTTGFDEPVLVRRRTTDLSDADRAAFTREGQNTGTMDMSSTEKAKADAQSLSTDTLGLYRGGDVMSGDNRDFVRAWMREVPSPGEHNALVMPDGSLSSEGIRRLRSSVLAKAFDSPELVARIVEDPDNNIRAIGNALTDAAPALAELRSRVARGELAAEFDIAPQVAEIANLIAKARQSGKPLGDMLKQDDIFAGRTDPVTEALAGVMFKGEGLRQPRSGQSVAESLRYYANEAGKIDAGPGLFGDVAPVKPTDILRAARDKFEARDTTGSLFDRAPQSEADREALVRFYRRGEDLEAPALQRLVDQKLIAYNPGAARPYLTDAGRALLDSDRNRRPISQGEAGYLDIEPLAKLFRGVANAFVDGEDLGHDLAAFKRRLGEPKAALSSLTRPMRDAGSALMFTNDGMMRSLAARFNSPAIAELADKFHARAGKGDGTGRTYHEAVQQAAVTRIGKAHETLSPFLRNKASLDRIRELLTNPDRSVRASVQEREAAGTLRELLKDTIDYRKKAGEDIGEVTSGYFPRVLDEAKVAKGREEFLRRAEKLYRSVGADDPKAAAQGWFERVFDTYSGLDGGLDHRGGGVGGIAGNTAKAREFGKEADQLLRDFYHDDVFQTLASYFTGSARRAEEVRRFGPKGPTGSAEREAWKTQHGEKSQADVLWDRIKAEVRDSGTDAGDVLHRLQKAYNANLGRVGSVSHTTRTMISYAHAWNQISKMDRTLITSLGELTMGFIRGGPRYGVSFVKDAVGEFGRQLVKAKPSDAQRWAEAISVAQDAMVNQALTARIGAEGATRGVQKTLAGFYRGILLHQFTEAERIAATRMGRKFIGDLANDMASESARVRTRAGRYLQELGIKDPEAFGTMLRKGEPDLEQVRRDAPGLAADYATALIRFVNQTVMAPSRAEKPAWSAHPVGSLFSSLLGYSFSFKKNVLDRVGRMGVDAFKEGDPRLLLPAAMLPIMGAFQYLNDTYLRPALFGSSYDFSEETPTEAALRTADRAGFTGMLSPVVNAFRGIKYDRSLSESLSGPVIGSALSDAEKIATPFIGRNSENTNTAERNAAAAVYDAIVEPTIDAFGAKYLKGVARTATIIGTGNKEGGALPGDKDAFVDSFGGEDLNPDEQ